jgi:hypothetical protein
VISDVLLRLVVGSHVPGSDASAGMRALRVFFELAPIAEGAEACPFAARRMETYVPIAVVACAVLHGWAPVGRKYLTMPVW